MWETGDYNLSIHSLKAPFSPSSPLPPPVFLFPLDRVCGKQEVAMQTCQSILSRLPSHLPPPSLSLSFYFLSTVSVANRRSQGSNLSILFLTLILYSIISFFSKLGVMFKLEKVMKVKFIATCSVVSVTDEECCTGFKGHHL